MAKSEDKIILVTSSDATAGDVSAALSNAEPSMTLERCAGIIALARSLEGQPARAVVVDVDPVPLAVLTELTPVVRQFAGTCFIIVSSEWSERLLLDAMAIGVRHFMRKTSVQVELVEAIRRLSTVREVNSLVHGKVVTVLSAGGGCGATTLAVNLANELCMTKKPVLLIDLDVAYGAIATYLNISGQYGLADVIANGNVVDGDLIASSTVPYEDGLHVLLSPASVNFSGSRVLDYEKMSSVLDVCCQVYAYTVVDAPRVSPEVAANLAASSKATLAVLQMSVKDIRIAREMRNSLIENGILSERVSLVINRYRKKGSSVSLAEMQRAVNSDNIQLIGNDFRPAARSVDLGEPLAKTAPMSSLRKDIRKLLTVLDLKPNQDS